MADYAHIEDDRYASKKRRAKLLEEKDLLDRMEAAENEWLATKKLLK